MAKIKLTKGELKRQRDSLGQFRHFLPTLQLKKQQLQTKILEARRLLVERQKALSTQEESIKQWVGLLADPDLAQEFNLKQWIIPSHQDVIIEIVNIAGANVPFFKEIKFPEIEYDLYTTPFWVDLGLEELKSFVSLFVEVQIIEQQIGVLSQELRITTQRVNLFEKVKIPECLENIRKIRIYLGDQQANAVGISKVAKKKIETAQELEVALV